MSARPKRTSGARSAPTLPRLAAMIEEACAGKGPEGLLFGDGVNHMRNSGSQGWFANAVKRAQAVDPSIPRLTPHDLRHTAASLAISSGANVKAVQRMLGHASAAMTLDTYADLFDDDLDAVAQRLERRHAACGAAGGSADPLCPAAAAIEQIAQFSSETHRAQAGAIWRSATANDAPRRALLAPRICSRSSRMRPKSGQKRVYAWSVQR